LKLLLDACVWGGARPELEGAGCDVVWAGEWEEDPGDVEILAHAHQAGRVLVTLDKDFGEIAVVHGAPHAGIIRLVGFPARAQGRVCLQVLERYREALGAGGIATVEPGRVRLRPGGGRWE
jgi:predicted nuclease of predicted toxin-antitoxin system